MAVSGNVANLITGAVVFVGDGKGTAALEPFWGMLRRARPRCVPWPPTCPRPTSGACVMLRETLRDTLAWAMQHVLEDAWDVPEVLIGLNLVDEPCTL